MNLEEIAQAQEELLEESKEYFENFYGWEEKAYECFTGGNAEN